MNSPNVSMYITKTQFALTFLLHRLATLSYRVFKESHYEEAMRIMKYLHAFELREDFEEHQNDPEYLELLKRLRYLAQNNQGELSREISLFLTQPKIFKKHAQTEI